MILAAAAALKAPSVAAGQGGTEGQGRGVGQRTGHPKGYQGLVDGFFRGQDTGFLANSERTRLGQSADGGSQGQSLEKDLHLELGVLLITWESLAQG